MSISLQLFLIAIPFYNCSGFVNIIKLFVQNQRNKQSHQSHQSKVYIFFSNFCFLLFLSQLLDIDSALLLTFRFTGLEFLDVQSKGLEVSGFPSLTTSNAPSSLKQNTMYSSSEKCGQRASSAPFSTGMLLLESLGCCVELSFGRFSLLRFLCHDIFLLFWLTLLSPFLSKDIFFTGWGDEERYVFGSSSVKDIYDNSIKWREGIVIDCQYGQTCYEWKDTIASLKKKLKINNGLLWL